MRAQKGFSLVELLLAVGIGTALLGMVWRYYTFQERETRVRQVVADVRVLVAAADKVYANNEGYQTPSATLIPQDPTFATIVTDAGNPRLRSVLGTGATPPNYWGGTWSASLSGGNNILELRLTQVPEQECIGILQALSPLVYLAYVDTALVGMEPAPTASSAGRSYMRPASLARECARPAAPGGENDIRIRFLKPFDYSSYRSQPFTNPIPAADLARLTTAYNLYQTQMTFRETALAAVP